MTGTHVKPLPVTTGFPLPTRYADVRVMTSCSHGVSCCNRIVMLNFRSDVMTLIALRH
ncbi:hypothetical protein K373_04150 [Streptomyces sp. DvalAA-21]|nr:hypothetical protein K373_04150 [Streptomyces sp. DvalAA-21]RAJ31566.1 hypothetical protein K351_04391 [Streptomyces sp. DpondAA-E10]RAJ46734.1 hypothetical protein K352_03785 [Streptomyces sp. DpondAA-A50]SCD30521.1 hypothetical protein GA0115239_100461 [Streptomyces sp. BpilaLS-43]SCL94092.1 hypothetical protein SAMN04883147_1039213 [Streptomyces sp. DpondAA-F4]